MSNFKLLFLLLLIPSWGCHGTQPLLSPEEQVAKQAESKTLCQEILVEYGKRFQGQRVQEKDLERLGQLAERLSEEELEISVRIYPTQELQIFSLPDGTIVLHAGILNSLSDEELLFLIAHNIGHIQSGEAARRFELLTRAQHKMQGDLMQEVLLDAYLLLPQKAQEAIRADEYAVSLLAKHDIDPCIGEATLRKLKSLPLSVELELQQPKLSERASKLAKHCGGIS